MQSICWGEGGQDRSKRLEYGVSLEVLAFRLAGELTIPYDQK